MAKKKNSSKQRPASRRVTGAGKGAVKRKRGGAGTGAGSGITPKDNDRPPQLGAAVLAACPRRAVRWHHGDRRGLY